MKVKQSRAIELAKSTLAWLVADTYESSYALYEAREIGFSDNKIEELGFGFLLDFEDELEK